MSDVLARRYLLLMRAYPAAYRRERGDEIVATLLERAGDRRWPPVREVLGLLAGALQAHLSPGGPARTTWAGGLRLAVLVLFAVELARYVLRVVEVAPVGRTGLAQLACGLVAFHAARRDRRIVALVAALCWQAGFVWAAIWSPALGIAAVLLAVLLAVGRRRPLPALHPAWWSVVPLVALVLGAPGFGERGPLYVYSHQEVVIMAVVALLAVVARVDARAVVVAAGLLVWQGVQETVHLIMPSESATGRISGHLGGAWWGYVAAGTTLALLVGGHLLARRRARLI